MFYEVNHSMLNTYKYAFKNLSFIGFSDEICSECGRRSAELIFDSCGPLRLLVEGGRKYPDWLQFTGVGGSLFILSERAVSELKNRNVTGVFSYDEVEILYVDPQGEYITDNSGPKYFNVKVNGSIDFDYGSMFLKKKKRCSKCGRFDLNRQRLYPCFLDISSWNSLDLCSLKTFSGNLFCTDKFVDVVKSAKLTGFEFEPVKTSEKK